MTAIIAGRLTPRLALALGATLGLAAASGAQTSDSGGTAGKEATQTSVDWLELAEKFEALATQRPQDGHAWLRWGEALLELDAPAEALDVFLRSEKEFTPTPIKKAAPRFGIARAQAALGRREEALASLEKAARSGFSDLVALERDSGLKRLAGDPRYQRIHEQLRVLSGPHVDPGILVSLEVPVPPSPFRAGGKTVLGYDVHVFSFWPLELAIAGFEVLDDSAPPRRIAWFEGAALAAMLERPGANGAVPKTTLAGNTHVVAYPRIELDPAAPVPARVQNRLWLRGKNPWNVQYQPIVEGELVPVGPAAVSIGPPLAGEPWVARSSGSSSYHRRGLQAARGRMAHPQNFAVDWARGEDVVWNAAERVARANQDFVTFGQDVLAVADGVIASARDGLPDNEIGDTPFVVPFGDAFGNYVVLDLGLGRYASYAHLMNGSLRVKQGDSVRRGQVVARVGVSGDSFGAHLHFHVSTSPSPYVGEGLPYQLDSFAVLGREDPERAQQGELAELDSATTDVRRAELPVDGVLVRFL